MLQHASADQLGQLDPTTRPGRRLGPVRSLRALNRRRLLVVALNIATVSALLAAMASLLSHGGWTPAKVLMLPLFAATLPWLSIGFWNAMIGAYLLRHDGRLKKNDPLALTCDEAAPIYARTAIVMAVRNEDPAEAVGRLQAIERQIDEAGLSQHFDFHVLSDTNEPGVAKLEEHRVAEWRDQAARPEKIFYRRRQDNSGFKAGNIEEFCARTLDQYDFFLPLDADSFMSAKAIARLVRMMQANPRIGILQTLVVGTPAKALFTRTFQFGMRHGMRAYTAGSAWWQGDCGPYWGHNALIRMQPFHAHCRLPVLAGEGPLSGHIMSHDQVEAVLMRRAGYHVRVLVEEGESYEENPPTLPDFIRRELRWCQGNMQYWQLLGMEGLHPTSRVQLGLAILMYLSAACWMGFIALGVVEVLSTGYVEDYPVWQGAALFALILTLSLMPKIVGVASILGSTSESRRYGGRGRLLAGAGFELVFSMLVAPIVSFAVAVFAVGLAFGKRVEWRSQERAQRSVAWDEAAFTFLPQTLAGIVLFGLLFSFAPLVLPWAMPIIAGFLLSIPFAVLSASGDVGAWSRRMGLCDIPEDVAPPRVLSEVLKAGRLRAGEGTLPLAAE